MIYLHGVVVDCCEHLSRPVCPAVGGEESTVTLCDLRSGSNTHQLRGHAAASVDTVRWSPAHHHLLATGGRDKRGQHIGGGGGGERNRAIEQRVRQ